LDKGRKEMIEKSSNQAKLKAIKLLKQGYSFEDVSDTTRLSLTWIKNNLDTEEKMKEEYELRSLHEKKLKR
jgi:hypothetical protein